MAPLPDITLTLSDLFDPSKPPLEHKWKIFQARYDYAWSYFDFHAKQRTTVFNYFVIAAGLFLAAYGAALKPPAVVDAAVLMTVLALAGAAITLAFAFLDRRNEELVHIAEDVLESLERDVLFVDYRRDVLFPRRRDWLGRMQLCEGRRERQLGILLRQSLDDDDPEVGPSIYSHGRWYPVVQNAILVVFIVLAILPWFSSLTGSQPPPTPSP